MPFACGVCAAECKDTNVMIACSGKCGKSFHLSCINNIADGKKSRQEKHWKCNSCRGMLSPKSGGSSSLGTNVTKEFLVHVLDSFKKEVLQELQTVKGDVTEVTASVNYLSDIVDTSNNPMKEMKNELAEMKKEKETRSATNVALEDAVSELEHRVRVLEQYARRTNIEISGLPVTSHEDVMSIVRAIGTTLGIQVEDQQIIAAYRVPIFKNPRAASLVVQFTDKAIRDSWLKSFKDKKREMTADTVDAAFKKTQVYINEHLSPENKRFLAKLKDKCHDVGFRFVWCRDGKFFVRKGNGERCFRINNLNEMDSLERS